MVWGDLTTCWDLFYRYLFCSVLCFGVVAILLDRVTSLSSHLHVPLMVPLNIFSYAYVPSVDSLGPGGPLDLVPTVLIGPFSMVFQVAFS